MEIANETYPVLLPELLFFKNGEVQKKVSLDFFLEEYLTEERVEEALLRAEAQGQVPPYNIFRPDSLEILEGESVQNWQKDDILLTFKNLDLIVLLTTDGTDVRWRFVDDLLHTPNASVVAQDGSLLIFNSELSAGPSVVHRMDPNRQIAVWSYEPNELFPFELPAGGSVSSLKNGNIVLAHEEHGILQEVQTDGLVLWQFVNPDRHRNMLLQEDENRPAEIRFMHPVNISHITIDANFIITLLFTLWLNMIIENFATGAFFQLLLELP